MPYKFSPKGDFRDYWGQDCLILSIESRDFGQCWYHVLYWDHALQDYDQQWMPENAIRYWYVHLETTEKQKRQQKLFQQLGNAHRAKHLLAEIFANSVDILCAVEREELSRTQYKIERYYIPALQAQMRNPS